ncbi:hypothetical protein Y032_0082g1586 [Ancylostoma ceylanicum]|uniref:Uncharacterized protein n=1 Tax=Ancylostoma ceylanicum TaxID=53326 RepID=A0A016TSR7_9BILA|nr:hypothetical protein Y032_0082g1586 [Ancylostoma ceylanicum]
MDSSEGYDSDGQHETMSAVLGMVSAFSNYRSSNLAVRLTPGFQTFPNAYFTCIYSYLSFKKTHTVGIDGGDPSAGPKSTRRDRAPRAGIPSETSIFLIIFFA